MCCWGQTYAALRFAPEHGVRRRLSWNRTVKILAAILLLLVAGCSMTALLSSASFLSLSSIGGLPLGNVVASFALAAPAGFAVLLSSRGSNFRIVALVVLGGALAWLPVSIALAGNLALNFSGWRGTLWLGFCLFVALAIVCSLAWSVFHRLVYDGRFVLPKHGVNRT